jgi:hypothetical protein
VVTAHSFIVIERKESRRFFPLKWKEKKEAAVPREIVKESI